MELFEVITQSHVVELFDGTWCETVAARLFTRKVFAFHHGDRIAVL